MKALVLWRVVVKCLEQASGNESPWVIIGRGFVGNRGKMISFAAMARGGRQVEYTGTNELGRRSWN